MLGKLSIDQALRKAKSHLKKKEIVEISNIVKKIIN